MFPTPGRPFRSCFLQRVADVVMFVRDVLNVACLILCIAYLVVLIVAR